jgi:hypothetical protein
MKELQLREAKTTLSAVVEAAANGEPTTITKQGPAGCGGRGHFSREVDEARFLALNYAGLKPGEAMAVRISAVAGTPYGLVTTPYWRMLAAARPYGGLAAPWALGYMSFVRSRPYGRGRPSGPEAWSTSPSCVEDRPLASFAAEPDE